MSNLLEIKNILFTKIEDFKNLIINLCNNDNDKNKINDTFKDLSFWKIMLFIMLINDNKMDGQINEFLEKFNIINNDENKNQIKEYYNYFLNVKSVFL